MSGISKARTGAGKIVLVYALLAALWILFSDTLAANLFPDPESFRRISIIKGWLFVVVTAGLLYTLITRQLRQILRKEEALAQSDRRFSEALRSARHLMYRLDVKEGRYEYLSPSVETMTGYSAGEFSVFGVPDTLSHIHPDDRDEILERLNVLSGAGETSGRASLTLEYRFRRKDGRYIWFEDWTTVSFDASGAIEAFVGTVYDITERKEREEQFRQVQKMESVGRLAGGIAHDFNNLLTVIIGQSDLALRSVPKDSPAHPRLDAIREASRRAATLTQQLLAYSRKQHLEPKLISPNAVVTGVEGILRRVIGEDIDLVATLASDIGCTKADPGQLEQVILNLAFNARDAMPKGGRIVIETGNVGPAGPHPQPGENPPHPGRYVFLSVSDTGSGMTEEVRSKAFDPFFTTKEVGQGTGLGLSIVYGIVAQSHGEAVIESRPGEGTTVRIFLPRFDGVPEAIPGEKEPAPKGGTGAILIVEDEEAVRKLMAQILAGQGYRVSEARDGVEGLGLLEDGAFLCDLLITDMKMPRLGGGELVTRVRAIRPGLRVLYISGYSDTPMGDNGQDPLAAYLRKPFTPDVFLEKVQEMI